MSKRRSRRNKFRRQTPVHKIFSAANTPVSNCGVPDAFSSNTRVANAAAEAAYRQAVGLAEQGDFDQARSAYRALVSQKAPSRLLALVENDIGALCAMRGEMSAARAQFARALAMDDGCRVARQNLAKLDDNEPPATALSISEVSTSGAASLPRMRTAILSILFNWPSTGGGTVHTAETAKFLSRAGYDVKHFYAQYAGWGVGHVTLPLDYPSQALAFESADWNAREIQRRFREAVDHFQPDYVVLTDSWNFKPLLAEAMSGYKYFLRLAAQECLCPLNNVRLLLDDKGQFSACPRNQLATADVCRQCVASRQHQSGSLHQAERALSGFGTAGYNEKLRRAFAEAEGVLAVNPLIAAAVSPFAKAVHVVPSGFDPERFPWPWTDEPRIGPKTKATIFFAGIVEEYMKGFQVLHAACAKLWARRQDFELVATCDPPGQHDPMTRFVGWLSQDELPKHLRQADFLVFPTIAEEALGRSAVEAMGVGRPVIASRIGGLPYTVIEGLTGLLFEPGNVDELASKIEQLLDDPALRERMGAAARQRFVEHFTWDSIIERSYRGLLKPPPKKPSAGATRFDQMRDDVGKFFAIPLADVTRMFQTFRGMRQTQLQSDGSRPSLKLPVEQEFLVCLLLSLTRPTTVVVIDEPGEVAVRHFNDMRGIVGQEFQVIRHEPNEKRGLAPATMDQDREIDLLGTACAPFSTDSYDGTQVTLPETTVKSLDPWEDMAGQSPFPQQPHPQTMATSGSFQIDILDRYGSGFIWLGAADNSLVEEVFTETSRHFGQWLLAVQGDGECDGRSPNALRLSELAERIGFIGSPIDKTNGTHRFRTFESAAGMTLVVPSHLCAPQNAGGTTSEIRSNSTCQE